MRQHLHHTHSPLAGCSPPWSVCAQCRGCGWSSWWHTAMYTKYEPGGHSQSWLEGDCKFRVVLKPGQPMKKNVYLLFNAQRFSLLNWKKSLILMLFQPFLWAVQNVAHHRIRQPVTLDKPYRLCQTLALLSLSVWREIWHGVWCWRFWKDDDRPATNHSFRFC